MKTKTPHTPGPWMATREEDGEIYIEAYRENAPEAFKRTVAVLQREWFADGSDGLAHTAALIAAAPDLLAALEAIIKRQDIPSMFRLPNNSPEIIQARAAIARAKAAL